MRKLPAVDLDIAVQSGRVWLVGGLCGIALAVLAAWWLAAAPAVAAGWRVAFAGLALLVVVMAWQLAGSRPLRLRWDGLQWFCAPALLADDLPLAAGRLSVMLDLNFAMLLRFDADDRRVQPRRRWIAVQRSGLAGQWHELRCAAYNAPHPAGVDAAAHRFESRQ